MIIRKRDRQTSTHSFIHSRDAGEAFDKREKAQASKLQGSPELSLSEWIASNSVVTSEHTGVSKEFTCSQATALPTTSCTPGSLILTILVKLHQNSVSIMTMIAIVARLALVMCFQYTGMKAIEKFQ